MAKTVKNGAARVVRHKQCKTMGGGWALIEFNYIHNKGLKT